MENQAYHFLEVFRQEVIKQYLILRYKIFRHIRTAVDKAYLSSSAESCSCEGRFPGS